MRCSQEWSSQSPGQTVTHKPGLTTMSPISAPHNEWAFLPVHSAVFPLSLFTVPKSPGGLVLKTDFICSLHRKDTNLLHWLTSLPSPTCPQLPCSNTSAAITLLPLWNGYPWAQPLSLSSDQFLSVFTLPPIQLRFYNSLHIFLFPLLPCLLVTLILDEHNSHLYLS